MTEKWYHLRCTKFTMAEYLSKKSRVHTEPWYCPSCISFPFSDLSHKDFSKVVKPDLDLKAYYKSIPNIDSYKMRCSVCTRKITKNQQTKSLPCIHCNSLVHRKCCNISLPDLLSCKPSHLKHWSCNACMSHLFPFQDIAATEIQKMTYNSLFSCPCLNESSDLPTDCHQEFRLTSNLYDNDTIYTHGPDPHNNMDSTLDINARFNYYTNHEFHKLKLEMNKNTKTKPLSVLHTNIESLMHNFDSLERLCIDLDYPFDVIAVTETWNPSNKKDKFIPKLLENYQKYNGLTGTTLKSGCGLYIRSDLKFKDRKDLDTQFPDDLNEFQCKFIEIINTKGANIILGVSYRHPKKASDNKFNNWLKETLVKISREHKTAILLGDFNYNLLKYSYDHHVTKFVDTMTAFRLQPTINKPTRIIKNQRPSIPDNIFTNSLDKDIITGNLISKISDHMPNFMIMNQTKFPKNLKQRRTRTYKHFDRNKYQEDISSIDIFPVLDRDANEIQKYYQDQVLAVMNKHAPYITLTKKQAEWNKKPWIGKRIQKLIKEKDHIYSKYTKKHSKFWYNRYRSLCDIVKNSITEAKKKYFSWYFKANINNSKKIWKGIKEIIHNKSSKDNEAIFLDDNGCIITDQKKVANKFNKFYTTIADKLVTKLGKPSTKYQDYLRNPNKHSIFLNETDPGEVAILLQKLDITKSGDVYMESPPDSLKTQDQPWPLT